MSTRRTMIVMSVVLMSTVLGTSQSAEAGPCRYVRQEFDQRARAMERAFDEYRHQLHDELRAQLDHWHADLRATSRLCPEERPAARRAIHAEIRATHRWYADATRELEHQIRAEREALRCARERAFHACECGHCGYCR